MTAEEVKSLYEYYRDVQKQNIEYEEALLTVSDQDEWLMRLTMKSTFLRDSFVKTEELLIKYIYPLLKRETTFTKENAVEFLNQVYNMEMEADNDCLFTTEILKLLIEYFKQEGMLYEEITSIFLLGLSYADRVNTPCREKACEYFEKICRMDEDYSSVEDENVRRRILLSFSNRLVNFDVKNVSDWNRLLQVLKESIDFYNNPYVRKIEVNHLELDEYVKDCLSSAKIDIVTADVFPTNDVLDKIAEIFVKDEITSDNFLDYEYDDVLVFLWYQYHHKEMNCNQVLECLFRYYVEEDRNIDYSNPHFYEEEMYQVQMMYIQECFRYLAKEECTLTEKDAVRVKLIQDFTRLYESIPYMENNAFQNMEILDILKILLRTVRDEDEAFYYIQRVVIRRNAMTLIHSTMLAQITQCIIKCLIKNAPHLFYELLSVDSKEAVWEKETYLLEYIERAAYIHDIGKIMISDVINLQTRKITDEEFGLIKQHPIFGAELIEGTILVEKYMPMILGHHRFSNGCGGYPNTFDNVNVICKVLIDVLTMGDCIDAATDVLGRNYASAKTLIPTVRDELLRDGGSRYNKEIVEIICNDKKTCDEIQYITTLGRVKVYYNIYQTYLSK